MSAFPAYHRVAVALRGDIDRGRWRTGEQMPTELELVKQFEVSRNTVRQALNELLAMNLVTRRQGRGTFVAEHGLSHVIGELKSLTEVLRERGFEPGTEAVTVAIDPDPPIDAVEHLQSSVIWRINRLRTADGRPFAQMSSWVADEIGRKLKVSTVLEGGVRKMGNRLRITAELVNVADGYHLWSERYDREIEDVFAIQDDISQAIVTALRVILSEGEKKAIEKKPQTNIQAYDYYLRGRQFFHQLRRRSLEYARQMFNKAIELDPDYALAYTGVADSSSLLYTYFDARDFNLRQADKASKKALELGPELAEAHVSRGIVTSLTHQFAEAERSFEKAMKLEPKMFEAAYWYGMGLQAEGRFEDAVKMFDRASTLRPEDYQSAHFLGQAYNALGNAEAKETNLRRGLRLMEGSLELNPDDARAANLAAGVYASLGESEPAIKFAERSLAIDPEDPMLLYNVACTYATLGRIDQAISCLERAVEKGFGHREWIDNDPDLKCLRDNPKYQAIVDAI